MIVLALRFNELAGLQYVGDVPFPCAIDHGMADLQERHGGED